MPLMPRFARSRPLLATLLLGASALSLPGCDGQVSTPPTAPIFAFRPASGAPVSASGLQLLAGDTLQLRLTASPAAGDVQIVYGISDPTIASISPAGLVTALRAGVDTLTATVSAPVTIPAGAVPPVILRIRLVVAPAVVSTLTIVGDLTLRLDLGQSGGFALQATGPDGLHVISPAVVWRSSDARVASVAPDGRIVAQGNGTAIITAAVGQRVATGTVVVIDPSVNTEQPALLRVTPESVELAVGGTVQAASVLTNARGAVLSGQAIRWSVTSGGGNVSVDSLTGLITARNGGQATVQAVLMDALGAATSFVGRVSVAVVGADRIATAVVFVVPTVNGVVGDTVRVSATATNAAGTALPASAVSYRLAGTAAALDGSGTNGFLTLVAQGRADLIATAVSGVADTISVQVSLAPVATVIVTTSDALPFVGGTAFTLTATARDQAGRLLNNRTVQWATTTPSLASITPAGVVTALAEGAASFSATSEGVTTIFPVTIRAAPTLGAGGCSGATLAVRVFPRALSVAVGGTGAVSATVMDGDGCVPPNQVVTWTSSNYALADVNPSTGAVVVPNSGTPGAVQIYATQGALRDSATVTVTSPSQVITQLMIRSSQTVIYKNDSDSSLTGPRFTTLEVDAADANGALVPLNPALNPVTWQYGPFESPTPSVVTAADVATFSPESGPYNLRTVQLKAVNVGQVVVRVTVQVGAVLATQDIIIYVRDRITP